MNICRSCGKEVEDAEFIEGDYGLCDDCAREEAEQAEADFRFER